MENKAKISCPQCGSVFEAEMPKGEIFNGEISSVFVVAHHFTDDCPKCGRKFVVVLQGINAQYAWVEQKPKREESRIVIPGAIPVPRSN